MKTFNNFIFIFFICFVFVKTAQATTFELGALYLTDDLTSTASTKSSKTAYNVAILMVSEGKNSYGVGWSYQGYSTLDTTTTDTKYNSTETGPKFIYYFGREKIWYTGLIYNLSAKAKYENSLGSAEWRGTSLVLQFGYLPYVTSKSQVGIKLNYHTASYNEQITNSTTLTATENKKTSIYPTIEYSITF